MQFYTDPARESDTYALPDARVYELTAREVAEMDDDTIDSYMRRREFRLAAMSDRVRDAMFDAMIEDNLLGDGSSTIASRVACLIPLHLAPTNHAMPR